MKILVVVMIVVGILCLIGTIAFVIYFKRIGKSLFEMQATLDCDEFTITEKGSYAIWFRMTSGIFSYPRLNIVINEVETGREIPLYRTTFKVERSSFTQHSRQCFWFDAEPGNYLMTIQRSTDTENIPLIDQIFRTNEQPLDGCDVFITKRINPTLIVAGIVVSIVAVNAIMFAIFLLAGRF